MLQAVIESVPPVAHPQTWLVRADGQRGLLSSAFQVTPDRHWARLIFELGNGQWNIPSLRTLLEEVFPANSSFQDYEVTHNFEEIGPRTMSLNGRRVEAMDVIVLSIEDITARKNAEKSAQERTVKLQEAVNELLHFSYTITHDMRAPLRAMQGYGELLLEEKGALSETGQMYVARISKSAERMDRLITDALDYAKLSQQAFEIQEVDTRALLRGMLDTYPQYQPLAAKISVSDTLPAVLANEAGLTQCFSNLLDNAIKFVQPGHIPEIQIRAEDKGELVRLWVEDHGIGIPLEYQDKVFGMFQRLHDGYEGTGIGLALVRKTAQRMNGSVGVESEPGQGSRFWLEFKKAV